MSTARFGERPRAGVAIVALLLALIGSSVFAERASAHISPPGCTDNDLILQLAKDKIVVRNGQVVTYTVSVGNLGAGGCDVTGATVSITLPAADGTATGTVVTLVTNASYPANTPIATVGTATYTVAVNPGVTTIQASATVSGILHDSASDADTATVSKTVSSVVTNPHTTLTKTANPTTGPIPLAVTFTYHETNDGTNAPLSGVTLTDDKCSPVVFQSGDTNANNILDPGETWVYTCAKTFTTPGAVTNTATAVGTDTIDGAAAPTETAQATVTPTKAPLPIATQVAPASITLGQTFTDTATLSPPAGGPAPTGTVTFNVYSPGDTTCTAAPIFTSPITLTGAGTSATSTAFKPTAPGTYRVIATYSGDTNYNASATLCNDAGEASVVAKAPLPIATQVAPASITLGQTFTDTATLSPPAGGPAPTGTVTFRIFGPSDTTCTAPPVFTSPITLTGAGTSATSTPFKPTAPGTYRVIASYSGDTNYNASATLCNDAGEASVVAKAPLPIVTQVAPASITLGQTFTDTATLTPPAGEPAPTGTVTFRIFGPGDTTCTAAAVFTSAITLTGAGTSATSAAFKPTAPGTYRVIASYGGDTNYNPSATLCNDAGEASVVAKAPLPIVTQVAPASITLGQTFTDTATLTPPAGGPAPTGTVTFSVFGPGDTTCTAAAVFTSAITLTGAGTSATSTAFRPAAAGTYRVIASYSGDTNYLASTTACNDAGEASVVAKAPLPIVTQVAPASITLGQTFKDTATLTPPAGGPAPTGTVTFNVYAPGDTTCSAAPVFTSPIALTGAGTSATSAAFKPTAPGTYRVIASYSGDGNYLASTTACNDAGEASVVAKAPLPIVTQVAPAAITLGQTFKDTATLSPPAGEPAPTGTVTFSVYGPADTTCSAAPVFTSAVTLAGAGTSATSGSFQPTATGTYRVIATYGGDTNYNASATLCNDAGEATVVAKAPLPIATQVAPAAITLGQTFTDTATLTPPAGGPPPTGTVTFSVFGPSDTTCTAAAVFTSAITLTGAGTSATSASFKPTAPGTYRVIASYSGDGNYNASATLCNDAGEASVVAKAPLPIVTQVAPASITLGQTFTDTATLTPPAGEPAPTGTVTFSVFGPGDTTCTAAAVFTSAITLTGAGTSATSTAFRPTAPGTYRVIASYSGDTNYNASTTACNDAGEASVVAKAPLPIVTQVAPASITLGQTFKDTATLTPPAGGPAPTGTVTFNVYAPGDTTCSAAPVFTSPVALTGAGTSATSAAFKPTAPGTYRVIASYSGDADYNPSTTACNDAGEASVVAKAPLPIVTQVAPAAITLGQTFKDTATLSPPAGEPAPTGTVTFNVYAPGDTTCSAAPVFTSAVTLAGAGTSATSGSFQPTTTGTYRVIASYSGDTNYLASATACNDANEASVVAKAPLPIATQVAPGSITLGQTFTDTATLTPPAGAAAPTGTVTFNVYGPADTTCSVAAVFTSTITLSGAGTSATSSAFKPTAPGTYRVIASYSGDTNYNPSTTACNDAGEASVVAKAPLPIVTQVAPASITLGQTFKDTATLTPPAGEPAPTGTVTFSVYGPGDTTCTAAPVFTSPVTLAGAGTTATSTAFRPTTTGTYRVIARYSGDANYNAAATSCNDPGEADVVVRAPLPIATQVAPAAITLGQSFTDTATLTPPAGAAAPTGTVTFRVFGPSDTTCTAAPVFSSTVVLSGPGVSVTSGSFQPTATGTYRVIASYSGDGNYNASTTACNDAGEASVVAKAPLPIATQVAPASITLGQTFTDTATLTPPAGGPAPTGTVTFNVYGPADTTCSATPVFTSIVTLAGAGTSATSAAFRPAAAGTYRVIANYSGDGNYNASTTACNDAGEASVVAKAPLPIATQVAPASITLGQTFTDTATLTPPAGGPAPTGTVTFNVYGPADTTCSATPVFTSIVTLAGAGTSATSAAFRPAAAGTYRVIANYSGDGNYNASTTACNDAGEASVVAKAPVPIATQVAPAAITLGQTFTDTATLTALAGGPAPTGTVTFKVYTPGDTTCTATPLFSSTVTLTGAGTTATSSAFRPTATGTYRVIASYSGDGNYLPSATACNDAGEASVVAKAPLPIATQVAPASITLGQTFTDTATLTPPAGEPAPTGTVTFNVYGPTDTTCSATPVFTSAVTLTGAGTAATSGAFQPTATGTYRVIASYGGDANYNPSATACNDAGEASVVAKAPVPIVTQVAPASITLGQTFTDTATLTPPAGGPAPTGTVTFNVYGPTDTTCSATPVLTSTVSLNGAGTSATSSAFKPTAPGTYRVIASYSGDANYNGSTTGCNDASEATVVSKAPVAIVTQVAPVSITLGQTFADTASLTPGPGAGAPTGTVTFNVYGPGDTTCSATPVFSSTISLTGSGTSATSATFRPTTTGTYRVIASYSGDANFGPSATACNDAGESEVVASAPLPIATQVAPAAITLGQTFHDTATLTPPAGAVAPTGTVTFNVYSPGDTTCAATPVFTSTNPLNLAGTSAVSGTFTPTAAGTYRVIASYSGDGNYLPAATSCNDAGEATVVAKAPLPVTTQVAPGTFQLGSSFTDTATLGPKPAGAAAPTGTVTFNVYGPADSTCTGPVLFSSTNAVNPAGTTATSSPFTPGATGTYRVIATYSGDANYSGSVSGCADATEAVVVTKAPLPIATQVSPATMPLGSSFTDTATVGPKPASGATPTGTVTFNVYGPGDTTCVGTVLFTSTNPLNPAGTTATSSSFTPGSTGTYRVIATYSGDANYSGSASACGDPTEAVVVTKAPLPVTTQVSPATMPLGSSFTDTATLGPKPAGAVAPTGTVTFNVYGPGDTTCTGPVLFTSTDPVNPAGTTATSGSFTPTGTGIYRVIATYSGDSNYAGSASTCGDPTEAVVVTKAPLPVTTQVSPATLPLGSSFTDTATLGPKPAGQPAPTGTVTFNVYGPGDTTCVGTVLFTSTNALNPAGTSATSSSFTPGATGTYRVIATYSGDANYAGSASGCGDPTEAVVVTKAPLPVTTQVSPATLPLGSSFTDTATIGPKPAGAATPTGTVTFNVYGPGDTTCSGAVLFSSTNPLNPAGTSAVSAAFTPASAGTYRVIATYSGDANYAGSASGCGDPTEAVVVTKAPLPVTTQVAPATLPLGSSFRDTATLGPKPAGAVAPTGTVTFNVYGPTDTTCSGPVLVSSTNNVNAAGTSATSDAFTPTTAGTYRVIATYSGDANYAGSASGCGDPTEAVVVAPAPLPIATHVSSGVIMLGQTFTDTATLGPVPAGVAVPTGNVTFNVYGPGDASCAGPIVFTSTNPLNSTGTAATSGTFAPGVTGTYRVIATYSGDTNYLGSASSCGDPAEAVVVAKVVLSVATAASVAADGTFADVATIASPPAGAPAATGSVTFNVYGPGDTTCAATPVFTSTNALNAAGTSATSASFRATAASGGAGTYRFVATYSGDPNYPSTASACNAANESVAIPTPVIAVTKAANPLTMPEPGGTFTFTVQVSNPSTVDPVTITSLTDNIYGNIATRPGSTCGTLIGVTLAPGATSPACTFTGPFTGSAGASQTDIVTVNGMDVNGFPATATAQATVKLTPVGPAIAVTKVATPLTRPAPTGTFTYTVQVSNPSTLEPVTITSLVDNVYGNLATRPGSTCGTLIGVVLAPGATSAPCSFTGDFTGVAGASETDTVTVTGVNNGVTVTATAHAVVSLTPQVIKPASAVSASTLHHPAGCVGIGKPAKVYVTGSNIKSVSYSLDGRHLGTATKRDSSGHYSVTLKPSILGARQHKLTAVVTYRTGKTRTLHATIAVCQTPKLPLFTG